MVRKGTMGLMAMEVLDGVGLVVKGVNVVLLVSIISDGRDASTRPLGHRRHHGVGAGQHGGDSHTTSEIGQHVKV